MITFFFNDTATTEIYTLSLHDALPISDGAPGENTAPHSLSGAVTFTDVNLSDIETSSITKTQVVATLANGYTLTAAQQSALVNAFTIDAATHSTTDGSGSIGWHYNINDLALDFLGKNDQVVLTFTVQVADGNGGFASQDVTITVHGAEDAPVITSGVQSGLVPEIADGAPGENTAPHSLSGAVTFTDVDLSDIETSAITKTQVVATLANGYTLTAAQQSTLVNAFTIDAATHSTTDGSGSIGWHYNINDLALDFLGTNDQVVLTFTVQVSDGNGGVATQDVKITVHGAEDAPVITSGVQAGLVTEIADGAPGENTAPHSLSGAVTFTDVDLSDIETSAITKTQVVATLANGYTLTAAQQSTLVNAFTIDAATHSTTDGSGSIGWHYNINDLALDFLGTNDQVVLTFTVQVADGNGGLAAQDVKITIGGTNDSPVITSGPQSGSVTEIADGAPGENTAPHSLSGAVTFTDVNLSDIETSSITKTQVVATLANGYTLTAAQQSTLVNAFTIDAATHSTTDGSGSIGWHYNINDLALDFLGTNDQVVLTFTVQVADGNGGFASQDVTITVHGAEDAPVITSGVQSGLVPEIADGAPGENTAPHSLSGAVTFTDVDLSDIETSAITKTQVVATLANGYTLTAAQQSTLVNAFTIDAATHSTTDGSGSIGWHYNINALALDFLGTNDQVVLTFTVQVADGNGGFASQDVTITVHGAEDAPVITSGVQAGLVPEIADGAPGENTAPHSLSGAGTFTDGDLSDIETSAITKTQVVATLANGYTLTAAQQSTLVNAFTIDAATHSTTDGSGSIGWHYNINDLALDFLGKNDQVVLTFTVQVADGNGGVATQDVTITVHGAEDSPVITSGGQTRAVAPRGDTTTQSVSPAGDLTDPVPF